MPETSSPRKSLSLSLVLLGVLVWVVYSNSLQNPFHFDDFHVIPDNPAVRGISDVPTFFWDSTTFSILPGNRDYRPVFLTSMALSWWVGDGSTWPFHVVSVTVHMGSVFLLLLILRHHYSLKGLGRELSTSAQEWAALVGAAIFALHPIGTESVNYISSQSVLLAGFFYLLSFYFFVKIYRSQNGPAWANPRLALVASYLAYSLALLSKPIAITLPLNLLVWELLFGSNHGASLETLSLSGRIVKRVRKHIPYVGLTLVYMIVRQVVLTKPFGTPARSLFSHYVTQSKALVFYYLNKALIPLGLNVDRQFPVSDTLADWEVLFSIFVLFSVAFILFRNRKHRHLVFWTLWFPVCLLVTTYLSNIPQVVNDHRPYLSVAGIAAVAGLLLAWLRDAFPIRLYDLSIGPHFGKALVTGILAAILVFLGLLTIQRNRVWASDFALWEDAALNGGTWRAHMNYGLALEDDGRREEALHEFKTAVDMFPGAYSHINLGLAYVRRDSLALGLSHLRKAVELWPTLPEAHLYLGYGLEQNGQLREAEDELLAAIRLRTNYLKGYRHLAEFYERRNQTRRAYSAYQTLLSLDSSQSWAKTRLQRLGEGAGVAPSALELGLQQTSMGNYAQAVATLTEVYSQNPQDRDLLFNLAFSHQKLGQRQAAIRYYEELLELAPTHVKGHFNLAYAYMEGSSQEELLRSSVLFARVLQLDPGYSESLFRLATVYWKLGDEAQARAYDRLYLEKGSHQELKRQAQARLAGG